METQRGSNSKAAQVRIQPRKAGAYAGQRKHDMRRGPQPSYVDSTKTANNEVLIEPPTPGDLRKVNEERRAQRDTKRAMRSDAAVAFIGILTFGAEAQGFFDALSIEEQNAAFEEAAQAVAMHLNTTVAGLVVHRDESAPHAHFVLPAYDLDGQPLTVTVKRQTLKELQDVTAKAFQRYAPDIERGRSVAERMLAGATRAETLNRSVRELHADLPQELAAKRKEVEEAEAKAEEMRERVAKLEAKAALTEKEAKRLETYRKRLADRVSAAEEAQAEAERLTATARAEADQAADDARRVSGKAAALLTATAALTAEMTAGTLSRTERGKIQAANPEALRQGMPDIAEVVSAAADAADARRREESKAEDARQRRIAEERKAEEVKREAANIMADANRIRVKLEMAMRIVESWIARIPALARDGKSLLKLVRSDPDVAPKKPEEESGPGL
ncbi:plasmid recombination protein [Paenirhodobacter populi]|uniref:plasmid recombination protein n=1 Tax=Paenirhodobacter populi TaxID=2306993 RepID=UPI000FE371E5|nr:plasmid recombination protein [Sinirhodobacter populi]RWR05094.1 hypothetical protein D2T32_17770 [Sinirhodobacter populi]